MDISTDHVLAEETVADRLLRSLDELVRRHRALALDGGEHLGLHTELIAAEVAQTVAVARSALRQRTEPSIH